MKHIIVIGSGFGGLAAAARLAARGYEVELFEKQDQLGGRASVIHSQGYTFDTGPTLITAPFMFDEIFEAGGRRREDFFKMLPLDPFYKIYDSAGRSFAYSSDDRTLLQEIAKFNPADVAGFEKYLLSTKAIFQKGFVELADKPFLSLGDMLKVAPDLLKLQSQKSVYSYVSQFIQDDFLRQVFSFNPLLIGGNPFDTTSIYAMIHYVEKEWGVWYAQGGMGSVIAGLGKLFEELGGKIHLKAEVCEILVEGRQARGIRTADGVIHRADAVVSNADVAWTYRYLIPAKARTWYPDWRIDAMRYSMSLVVIYFGTKKRYTDRGLAHHNIILGPRYQGLLDDIFHKKVLADDFSLYLHMPTLTDPCLAPEGGEAFYVLSPVPHLGSGTDWAKTARPYRDRIMQFLEKNYLPDLQENIVTEHMVDPRYYQNELNSYRGAAFSVEPILTQSAWFRPHNRSEDFDNLYFVGAGTHPGAGLPGVLSSAKIAEDLITASL